MTASPDLDAAAARLNEYIDGPLWLPWGMRPDLRLVLDALERLARELDEARSTLAFVREKRQALMGRVDELIDRADTLAAIVRAADAMYAIADHTGGNPGCYRCDAADDYLAARAKVTL